MNVNLNIFRKEGATNYRMWLPFYSSYSESSLDRLYQRLPFFLELLENSLAAEVKTVVVAISRVSLELHFDISDIHIFLLIGVIERRACFE